MKLANLFGAPAVAPGRLRQEIFALGDRHQGDALKGARHELDDPDLTPERRSLLRAVVAHLGSGGAGGAGASAEHVRRPTTLADAIHLGVIAAATAWIVIVLRSLLS